MRRLSAALLLFLGPCMLHAQTTTPPCTGLCLQQVVCPNNGTTSISGVAYAPNGMDPLPNITVYIPNAPVDPFTPGVSCPVVGAPPSGTPLVGTTTDFDGSFTLTNVPVGTNIPLVIVSGRWRRQVVVASTTACQNVTQSVRFPQTQSEGDIPRFAVATGSADQVECVLRKVGLADAEFTDPSGTGRVNLFAGTNGAGAVISSSTPNETVLMENLPTLSQYDVLMLPCEGTSATHTGSAALNSQLTNLVSYANAGGRVYASHFSYTWMYANPPFDKVANWFGYSRSIQNSGTTTVNTSFSTGNTLSQWLQLVGASTTPGQMIVNSIKHDFAGVNAPTQTFLTLNNALDGDAKPVMQFVFDAPVGNTTSQCGKVLYNEYHVETGGGGKFPNECISGATMTPQEKLLEFSLFELTNDGGEPTLTPPTGDFGNEAVGFTSAPINFIWTNNSSFSSSVNSASLTGPFNITGNNCGQVAAGASCVISVTFVPTALGAATGRLVVGSTGKTIYAALTGNGVPGLTIAPTAYDFGSADLGTSRSASFTLTNTASGSIPLPPFVTTGDYTSTNNCANPIPANSTCSVTVTFSPTGTGTRAGTLSATSGFGSLAVALTGNGVDFSITISPTSSTIIAGKSTYTVATLQSIAGFNGNVIISCTFTAPGAGCSANNAGFTLNGTVVTNVVFTTTSKYTVIGYAGWSSSLFALTGLASALLLFWRRKSVTVAGRLALLTILMIAAGTTLTGCSGRLPDQNATYTAPGPYTFTITATDGVLTHSATYTLTTTAQ